MLTTSDALPEAAQCLNICPACPEQYLDQLEVMCVSTQPPGPPIDLVYLFAAGQQCPGNVQYEPSSPIGQNVTLWVEGSTNFTTTSSPATVNCCSRSVLGSDLAKTLPAIWICIKFVLLTIDRPMQGEHCLLDNPAGRPVQHGRVRRCNCCHMLRWHCTCPSDIWLQWHW